MTLTFWHHFEHYVLIYPGLGGIFGALLDGLILVLVAIFFTNRFGRINATLDFSKRYHDLLEQRQTLHNKFLDAHPVPAPGPTEREKDDAQAWWWRFFDLLLSEYDFRRHGQLDRKRFCEWMTWRWYDFNGWQGRVWQTCGVSYADGWRYWKSHPAVGRNPLIAFLDDVHGASNPRLAVRRVRLYSTVGGRSWRGLTKWLCP